MNKYTSLLNPFWNFSEKVTYEDQYKKSVLGIPRRFFNVELDQIDPCNERQVELINYLNAMERNPSKLALIVNGVNHCGKTHIACGAVSYFARSDSAYKRGDENAMRQDRSPRYVNESDLLNRVTGYGKTFDWFSEYTEVCAFLVIDEFGSNQWTSVDAKKLGQVLNKRFNNGYQTVLLTNRNMSEMFNLLSDDVKSRFRGCLHVTMQSAVDPYAEQEERDVPDWLA